MTAGAPSGVPWQVRGVRPQTRAAAQEAARRTGLSIGQWLDSIIIDTAADVGVPSYPIEDTAESDKPEANSRIAGAAQALIEAVGQINAKLDQIGEQGRSASRALAQQIDSMGRALAAVPRERVMPAPARAAPFVAAPPLSTWSLDDAVAEITQRQHELDRPAEPLDTFIPPAHRVARDEVAALGDQLKELTARIEQVQRPCRADDLIAPLRAEIAEISRAFKEALPRRAIEALEGEVRKLAARVDATREHGFDPAVLAPLERGLAEVRDALRGLTPAEHLAGFSEGVKALSQKIELLAANGYDPGAIAQLENAIAGLRGIMSHVASGEAIADMAREVRALADKIDHGPGDSSMLNHLEQRIGAIAEALQARRIEDTLPSSPALDASIAALTSKIETLQSSRDYQVGLGQIEDRVSKLLDKLDASEARLGQLDSIERGMAELLGYLNDLRADKTVVLAAGTPPVEALQRDMARTRDSLEAVHDTMSSMVGRLAMIETDIRREPPGAPRRDAAIRPEAPMFATPAPQPPAPATAMADKPATPAAPSAPPPSTALATLPADDLPLEPGSGPPAMRHAPVTAAERIAASEALLPAETGRAGPGDPASKQNFILAARRAAQAAAGDRPAARGTSTTKDDRKDGTKDDTKEGKLAQRMKSLFVGISVVLILAGMLRLAIGVLDQHDTETPSPANAALQQPPAATLAPAPTAKRDVPGFELPQPSDRPFVVPTPRAPQSSSSLVPDDRSIFSLAPASGAIATDAPPPKNDKSDVTGSVSPVAPAIPPTASIADGVKLPVAIGGRALLNAAANGDAAAAYEVGSRFAEGRTVPVNLEQAASWFERAAKAGLAPAQFRLGSLYEKGQGVKKDLMRARDLYVAAADKGNAKAMHNLAVLYAEGLDGKPDYAAASQWFRKAAEHGVADSQYNLGVLYARGIGIAQNLTEAFKWFALAAQQGDQDAAKKRDDVATRLDAKSLESVQRAVQAFVAEPQPDDAVTVAVPGGAWELEQVAPAKPKAKTRGKTVAL